MSIWSKKFNELPKEIRHIGAMTECEMRINQLELEKARLKKHYLASVAEVNEHIKNLKDWLRKEGNLTINKADR